MPLSRLTPLLAAFGTAFLATSIDAKPPNFIIILADDLGYMDISPNNPDTFYKTPNLEKLAQGGTRFTDGYASCPVCSPTRYSMVTGRYPARSGLTNWLSGMREGRFKNAPLQEFMPLEELTLAEALKENGYQTAFVGKWHLGPDEKYWPQAQGFDINIGGHNKGSPPGGYFSPYKNPKLEDGPRGEYLTSRLGDESVNIIEKFKEKPFLLYLSFYAVHTPLQAPKELVAEYEKRKTPGEEFGPEEQVLPIKAKRQVRIRQNHATYGAMVQSMDAAVGKVLDKLEAAGLEENTVVIFTSDNGGLSTSEGSPTSNLPLRGGKGWLYEGGIREPFIVKWPGVTKPGSVCDEPVICTDIYPTVLEAADMKPKPGQHQDGVSLVPVLKDPKANLGRESLFWHYPHYANQGGFPGGAIRSGDWKLIQRYEDGRVHLYNLAEDIGERNDLSEKMPEKQDELREELTRWQKEVGAKFLRAKPGGPEPWKP